MLPQRLQQHRRICTNHLIDLVAVLVEQKRGHGADAQLLAQLGQLVDVKLDKVDLALELCVIRGPRIASVSTATRVFRSVGILFQDGSNGLARPAPCGEAVDNDCILVLDDLLELFGT